jgi:aryl-alcohol dehydrogenase-like predicted oxidoreductase
MPIFDGAALLVAILLAKLGAADNDGPWSEIIKTAWDAGVRSFDTSP